MFLVPDTACSSDPATVAALAVVEAAMVAVLAAVEAAVVAALAAEAAVKDAT